MTLDWDLSGWTLREIKFAACSKSAIRVVVAAGQKPEALGLRLDLRKSWTFLDSRMGS
jgi:hypothetical protein